VIDEVVAPLLHNKDPEAVVVKVELPQELTTVMVGFAGRAFGAATPLATGLIQPLSVLVTV
jgi:hypothetical protein